MDIDPDRLMAAAHRLSYRGLEKMARTKYPEIKTLSASHCEELRVRAFVPSMIARIAKRLWARGHTIGGEPPVNGFW